MDKAGHQPNGGQEEERWSSSFEALFSQDSGHAGPTGHMTAGDHGRTLGHANTDISKPNPTIGTPGIDTGTWDGAQDYADTCGIRGQEFILEQFTGVEINEDALIDEALAHGWYTPGDGTMPHDLGRLLELHGVEVNRYVDANQWQLARELAQGHKVMIGVDAGELWGTDSLIEKILETLGFQLSGADHVVIVSGIDTRDPDNIQVIVSDPGTGDPVASYPMDQFLAAWKDSEFYMVATQDPAPAHLPEMANFPYDEGHIDNVAGVPYDQFLDLQLVPHVWDDVFSPHDTGGQQDTLFPPPYPGIYPGRDEPGDDLIPPFHSSMRDLNAHARTPKLEIDDSEILHAESSTSPNPYDDNDYGPSDAVAKQSTPRLDHRYNRVSGMERDSRYMQGIEPPGWNPEKESPDLGVFDDSYFDALHKDDDDG